MTISEIRDELSKWPANKTPEYCAKQIHPIPDAPVVDRERFILDRVFGKAVLEFGASGPLQKYIRRRAKAYHGMDRQASERDKVYACDLDDPKAKWTIPAWQVEVIVCGEVLEHLSNPGLFLKRLNVYWRGVPLVISVPNAFSASSQKQIARGVENVNADHVAWYSPQTLKTLLGRAGYTIQELAWYKGKPGTAEGLIVVAV